MTRFAFPKCRENKKRPGKKIPGLLGNFENLCVMFLVSENPIRIFSRRGTSGHQDYFLPSNCSFKAASASMSPSVVEAT